MTNAVARPRDAATLILVRDGRQVLMGRRHPRHAFLPERYVFPGGRVDRADNFIEPATALRPEIEDRLRYRTSRARPQAFGLAAIRETFEETGLCLGRPSRVAPKTRSLPWRAFFAEGVEPTLHVLDYFARAITPSHRPRRFDARFFVANADCVHGSLGGNGELLDLQWVALERAYHLPMPRITALVLELLEQHLGAPAKSASERRVPLILFRRGRYLFEYH